MISLLPSVAPLNLSLAEGSGLAEDTHWDASLWRSSVLSNAPLLLLYPPVTKYVWVNKTNIVSIRIVQPSTYHLVVVVVIATTVESPRCLQAGQLSGHSIGGVHQDSGDVNTATDASCDDDVVTAGHLDTTSVSGLRYQLAISFNLIVCEADL